jgi:hypothetical protein
MLNSIFIFVLRLTRKEVSDGNFCMVLAELVATVVIVAIIRNTH